MQRNSAKSTAAGIRSRLPVSVALCLAAILTNGCTSLAVTPDRVKSDGYGHAVSGIPYALPMLQYDVKAVRTLSACPELIGLPGADRPMPAIWAGDIAFELEVTAVGSQVTGERYRVDYSKLDSAFKTTSFAIEYHPGSELLKSVNASADDRTGEIIGNTVKAGLAIASVAAGPAGVATAAGAAVALKDVNTKNANAAIRLKSMSGPLGAAADKRIALMLERQSSENNARDELIRLVEVASVMKPMHLCSEPTAAKVRKRAVAAEELRTSTAELTRLTAQVDQYSKVATVRGLNDAGRAAFGVLVTDLLKSAGDVEGKKKALASIEAELGTGQEVVWPQRFDEYANEQLAPLSTKDQAQLKALFQPGAVLVRVLDAKAFAAALASSQSLPAFRIVAKKFVDKYVDDEGAPKRFSDPASPPKGCAGGLLDLTICVASLTSLRAELKPVASDDLPDCKVPEEVECRRTWAQAAEIDAAKQQDARAAGGHRRSALPKQVDARAEDSHRGLFVRPPVRATLVICRAPSTIDQNSDNGCAAGTANLVKDDKVVAPQLGRLLYLRLVNQAFSNNGLVLSLTKEGAIEKFQYSSSKAILQSVSAAAADAGSQVAAWDKQRREEYEKNSDPLKAAQDEIALRTARQTLAAFDVAKSPSDLELIQLDKARADLAIAQSQAVIQAAQAAALTRGP